MRLRNQLRDDWGVRICGVSVGDAMGRWREGKTKRHEVGQEHWYRWLNCEKEGVEALGSGYGCEG